MTPRVTVVAGSIALLDRRAVESLDRQSLAPSDYEVVVVDDGTDPRLTQRLADLAEHRTNYRACAVEPGSSWSSGLTAGVKAARGEFVLLLGEGQYLRGEALERLTVFAASSGADLCLGRSTAVGGRFAVPAAIRADAQRVSAALVIEEPSAGFLYRREFLATLSAVEDACGSTLGLDLAAVSSTTELAALVSYQCFVAAEREDLATAVRDLRSIGTAGVPADVTIAAQRTAHRRALSRALSSSVSRDQVAAYAAVLPELLPSGVDDRLGPDDRRLTRSLRDGDYDALSQAASRRIARFTVQVRSVGVHDGAPTLQLEVAPAPGTAPLPADRASAVTVTLSAQKGRLQTRVPDEDVRVTPNGHAGFDVVVGLRATILGEGDLTVPAGVRRPSVTVSDGEMHATKRIGVTKAQLQTLDLETGPMVCFAEAGKLGLDLRGVAHPIVSALDLEGASVAEGPRGSLLQAPVSRLSLHGQRELQGQLSIGELPVPATIHAGPDGRPVLSAWVCGLPGSYRLSTRFSRAAFAPAGLRLEISATGQMTLRPVGRKPPKRRPTKDGRRRSTARRIAARLLRRLRRPRV